MSPECRAPPPTGLSVGKKGPGRFTPLAALLGSGTESLLNAETWYWVSSTSRPTQSMFCFIHVSGFHELKRYHPLLKVSIDDGSP